MAALSVKMHFFDVVEYSLQFVQANKSAARPDEEEK